MSFPKIVKIIMLATSSDALLSIASTGEFAQGSVRIDSSQKDSLELVHACEIRSRLIARENYKRVR